MSITNALDDEDSLDCLELKRQYNTVSLLLQIL